MVKKVDRPTRFDEWKSKFVSRPGPWWPGNKFMRSERDWTVEEYLQWCEEQYPLSERNKEIIKKLNANPEFRTRVREWRKEFRAKPSELKAMSREEWIEWYYERMPIDPRTWEDVRATCLRLKVTPRWQDFLLSCAFFKDGRAGYVEISNNFADCFWRLPDGLVEVSFYVHQYLTQDDLLEGLWPCVERLKLRMYDQREPRLRTRKDREKTPEVDEFEYLLYYLAEEEHKTVREIDQILTDVLAEDPPKPLDESIRNAFPGKWEKRLRRLIRDEFKRRYLGPTRIETLIRRLRKKFGLRVVETVDFRGRMMDERDAIELYKIRRQRYHY